MDYCHCPEPQLYGPGPQTGCRKCGLWYNAESWRKDTRVHTAWQQRADLRIQLTHLVDDIMAVGKKKKP